MNKQILAIFVFLATMMVVQGNYDFCAEGLTRIEKFSLAQQLVCSGEFEDINSFFIKLFIVSEAFLTLNYFRCSFRKHQCNQTSRIQDTKVSLFAIIESDQFMLRNKQV